MKPKQFAVLVEKQFKAERDMLRNINRWTKLRTQVRRAERTLDKQLIKKAANGDWRTLAGELPPTRIIDPHQIDIDDVL